SGRGCSRSDERGTTTRSQHSERLQRDIAPNRVEHCVAVRHLLGKVVLSVVDDLVRPEIAHVGMIRRARGGDDVRPDVFRELDRNTGDSARSALDQDFLAALKLKRVLDRDESRQTSERKGGTFGVEQRVRFSCDDCGFDRDLLGIRALLARVADSEDRIAYLEVAHPLAQRRDNAREVPPENVWKVRGGRIATGAHLPIGGIHAGGMNIHEQFAWAGHGVWYVPVLQDLGASMLHEEGCFHRYHLLTDEERSVTA